MSLSVHIVGTGLIGASLGLALTQAGATVTLEDPSPTAVALARDLGAGSTHAPHAPQIVVVAAPPDVCAGAVADALERFPEAVVTDVASVKGAIRRELQGRGLKLARYVGSHPMAGRERSGAIAARSDLFRGRAWVICPGEDTDVDAINLVKAVATSLDAAVTQMPADVHDRAVAAVSHVPQLASSLVAARLEPLEETALSLAGQGLRDVTRIAASDPRLWTQILAGNAAAVHELVSVLVEDLSAVRDALGALAAEAPAGDGSATGARGVIAARIEAGNAGHARIPGKHGTAPTAYASVMVIVPDRPGTLAQLMADIGDVGANIEDIRLDHGLGQAFAVAEILVVPAVAARLSDELEERGWRIHR